MNKDQLLSLTLRQLRQEASKLSVPLYSRKTKAVLVDLILKYQEKSPKITSINISHTNPENISEFQKCDFKELYIEKFPIPFVESSRIKIGLKVVEKINIQSN